MQRGSSFFLSFTRFYRHGIVFYVKDHYEVFPVTIIIPYCSFRGLFVIRNYRELLQKLPVGHHFRWTMRFIEVGKGLPSEQVKNITAMHNSYR
jgi:hypothetical protein